MSSVALRRGIAAALATVVSAILISLILAYAD
jgi:hypothetical protein